MARPQNRTMKRVDSSPPRPAPSAASEAERAPNAGQLTLVRVKRHGYFGRQLEPGDVTRIPRNADGSLPFWVEEIDEGEPETPGKDVIESSTTQPSGSVAAEKTETAATDAEPETPAKDVDVL